MEKLVFIKDTEYFYQSLGIDESRITEMEKAVKVALDNLGETLISDSELLELALDAGQPKNLAEHTFIAFAIGRNVAKDDPMDDLNDIY